MNTLRFCANNKNGCSGNVQTKGLIFCDECIEKRKNNTKQKRDVDMDNLIIKNIELEGEIEKLRRNSVTTDDKEKEIKNKLERKEREFEILYKEFQDYKNTKTNNTAYTEQLEKENKKLYESINKLRSENEAFIREKENYEMLYSQIVIDKQHLSNELLKIKDLYSAIVTQNELLNKEISVLNQSSETS